MRRQGFTRLLTVLGTAVVTVTAACPAFAQTPAIGGQPYQSSRPRQPPVAHEINPLAARYIEGLRARQNQDFAELYLYRGLDLQLLRASAEPGRVVFLGDSITDLWELSRFFPGKPYVNRGIAGQVTAQMVLRMQQDVVQLRPAAVVLLSGTNDIAGQLQVTTPQSIEDNWRSMAEIAKANGIVPVFCSILPTHSYTARAVNSVREHDPTETRQLNAWLSGFAQKHGYLYVDYTSVMSDAQGRLRREFSEDGIHPNAAGYAAMQRVLGPVLDGLQPRSTGRN